MAAIGDNNNESKTMDNKDKKMKAMQKTIKSYEKQDRIFKEYKRQIHLRGWLKPEKWMIKSNGECIKYIPCMFVSFLN